MQALSEGGPPFFRLGAATGLACASVLRPKATLLLALGTLLAAANLAITAWRRRQRRSSGRRLCGPGSGSGDVTELERLADRAEQLRLWREETRRASPAWRGGT